MQSHPPLPRRPWLAELTPDELRRLLRRTRSLLPSALRPGRSESTRPGRGSQRV